LSRALLVLRDHQGDALGTEVNALKKIQWLAVGVIVNAVAAMALGSPTQAQAACGTRFECTHLNCNNPFWAQSACYANLPPGCSYTTAVACYEGGTASCLFMVQCQDQ
jgi:hypothetical protein